MMKIAVASTNPTKLEAVDLAAFDCYGSDFEIVGQKVDSGVSDQPMSDDESATGAENRAYNLRNLLPGHDLYIGLEGGVERLGGRWIDSGIVFALGSNGVEGFGRSVGHVIPKQVMDMILEGIEMSDAVGHLYGTNTAEDRDCSGVITAGAITAREFYRMPALLAIRDWEFNSQQDS